MTKIQNRDKNDYEIGIEISKCQDSYNILIDEWSESFKEFEQTLTTSSSPSSKHKRNFDQIFTSIYSLLDFKKQNQIYGDVLQELKDLEPISHKGHDLGKSGMSDNIGDYEMSFGMTTENNTYRNFEQSPTKFTAKGSPFSNSNKNADVSDKFGDKLLNQGAQIQETIVKAAEIDNQAIIDALRDDRISLVQVLESFANLIDQEGLTSQNSNIKNIKDDTETIEKMANALNSLPIFSSFEEVKQKLSKQNEDLQKKLEDKNDQIHRIRRFINKKIDLEVDMKNKDHQINHLKKTADSIQKDIDQYIKSIDNLEGKREGVQENLIALVNRSTNLSLKIDLLVNEQTIKDEQIEVLKRKLESTSNMETEVHKNKSQQENELNLHTSEYIELLKTFNTLKMNEHALAVRSRTISSSNNRLKADIEAKTKEIRNKIREVENEESKINQMLRKLEEEPAVLENKLRTKIEQFGQLNYTYMQKKLEIESFQKNIEEYEDNINNLTNNLGNLEILETECKQKKEEWAKRLKKYLDLESQSLELNLKLEHHINSISDINKKLETEFGIKFDQKIKNKLSEIEALKTPKSIEELIQILNNLEKKVNELAYKTTNGLNSIQEELSESNHNLKSLGFRSNIGSVQASANDQNIDDAATVVASIKVEKLEKLSSKITDILDQVQILREESNPNNSTVETLLQDHQRTIGSKLDSCFRETQNFVKKNFEMFMKMAKVGQVDQNEDSQRVKKEDLDQVQLEILKNMKSEILQIIEESYTKLGSQDTSQVLSSMAFGPKTPLKQLDEHVFIDSSRKGYLSGQGGNEFFKIVQLVFKISSLFVNTIADFVKDSPNYPALRKEIIR